MGRGDVKLGGGYCGADGNMGNGIGGSGRATTTDATAAAVPAPGRDQAADAAEALAVAERALTPDRIAWSSRWFSSPEPSIPIPR